MAQKKFKARKGATFTDKDAKVIGNYLSKAFPDGSPDPETIVDIAKDKKNPIHKYFDWDDKKAAEKWRILQAQRMIQMVYIELTPEVDLRQWESVVVDGKRRYQDSRTIRNAPDLVDQVIQSALLQLEYWQKKYSIYSSLKPLVADITKVREKHSKELMVKKKPVTKKTVKKKSKAA